MSELMCVFLLTISLGGEPVVPTVLRENSNQQRAIGKLHLILFYLHFFLPIFIWLSVNMYHHCGGLDILHNHLKYTPSFSNVYLIVSAGKTCLFFLGFGTWFFFYTSGFAKKSVESIINNVLMKCIRKFFFYRLRVFLHLF